MVATTSNANVLIAALLGPAFTGVPISAYMRGNLARSVASKSTSCDRLTRAV